MSNRATTNSGGIGVLGLLGVVFVTLKLLGLIDWSWWWVTVPFWVGFAAVLLIAGCAFLGASVASMFKKSRK